MSKEQGTISWCYARGREAPNQRRPPLTCGVLGSEAWKAFRRGQNDARIKNQPPETNHPMLCGCDACR